MPILHDRRCFLAALSAAGATGLLAISNSTAQEAPPETTTIRLTKIPVSASRRNTSPKSCLRPRALPTSSMSKWKPPTSTRPSRLLKSMCPWRSSRRSSCRWMLACRSCCSAASTPDASSCSVPSACGLFTTSRGARSPCQVSRRRIMCSSPASPLTSESIQNAILNS